MMPFTQRLLVIKDLILGKPYVALIDKEEDGILVSINANLSITQATKMMGSLRSSSYRLEEMIRGEAANIGELRAVNELIKAIDNKVKEENA